MMADKPGIWPRLKLAWRTFQSGLPWQRWGQVKSAPISVPEWRQNSTGWQLNDFESYVEEGFNLNSLIYACTIYKARATTAAPLRAYSGDVDHPEVLKEDHPLAKLVARPNPWMSGAEFQQLNECYLNIGGNVYMALDRPKRGALPTAMYTLRPDRVRVIPGPDGLKGYVYIPEGKTPRDGVPFLPEDMIHVKFPNPGDPLEGLGPGLPPLSAIAYSGDVDNDITRFLKMFFQSGAMGNMVLKFKTELLDEEVIRVRERFVEVYGGWENWGMPLILDNEGDADRLSMTFDEMGFETLDERNESRICSAFGIAPILVGSRIGLMRSTYANYKEARQAFWQDVFVPELNMFETEYRYYLAGDDGTFVAFDFDDVPALQQDKPALIAAAKELWSMGMPLNMALEAVGLEVEKVPGGDVGYLPLSLLPIGAPKPAQGVTPTPEPDLTNDGAASAVEEQRSAKPAIQTKAGLTSEAKAMLWKAQDRIAQSWEERCGQAAIKAFEADRRNLLALLGKEQAKSRELKKSLSWSEMLKVVGNYYEPKGAAAENWRSVFTPVFAGVLEDEGQHWSTVFGTQFDVRNLQSEQWFQDYTLTFADPISANSEKTLSELLQTADREGWGLKKTRDQMESVFSQWTKGGASQEDFEFAHERMPQYRIDNIARTESMRAANAGGHYLQKELGAKKKEWLSTMDDRTRDTHATANGQVVEIDERFSVGGEKLLYPGDPAGSPGNTCQCRCSTIPVLDGTEKPAAGTQPGAPGQSPEAPKTQADYEESIRYLDYEESAAFDQDGNLLFTAKGGESAVKITSEQAKQLKGATYLHNHPNLGLSHNIGFSSTDIDMAARNGVGKMVVVGSKYRYSFDGTGIKNWGDKFWIEKGGVSYRGVQQRVAGRLGTAVRKGKLTDKQADEIFHHEVMVDWSKKWGGAYTREEM